MRISDWSSDVCSSDLLSEDVVQRCKDFVFGVEEAEGHVRPIAGEPEDVYEAYSAVGPLPGVDVGGSLLGLPSDEGDDEEEDDGSQDAAQAAAFERMVQHEVLRLEVREEATQRYRAKQEPEDSEPLRSEE